jgi:ligand-binding SRPBCC domain-containing protein
MAKNHRLVRSRLIARPLAEVFEFFADAANLEALTPPYLRFRILSPLPIPMEPGARIDYALSLFGVPLRWRTRITDWRPGVQFVDEQESGPYAFWRHTHRFEARGDYTLVHDLVEYREPLGPLGALAHALFVRRTLDFIFNYRGAAMAALLHRGAPRNSPPIQEPTHVRAAR